MKSQIFAKAWELFRMYEITFSEALQDAWKLYKREILKAEFAQTSPEEVTYRAKLVARFNDLKPCTYLNRVRKSDAVSVVEQGDKWHQLDRKERETKMGYYSNPKPGFENYSFL